MFVDEYLRNTQEYDELVQDIERSEAKETKKAAKAGGQESTTYKSNDNSMDNAAEDVEAVKKSLVELAENAWDDKSFHGKVSFKPSQKLKEKIKELMGHDISEVFITADNMRHLRNRHGEAEEKRGQVNFKPEMAEEIYDVVNDFDSATKERNDNKGNQNVLVVRKGNGDSFALLVERGKKKAEVKTFYKKTKTPLMSDAKSPNLNAQSDSVKSSVTSSVSQEKENVERENFDTNVLKGVEGLWESAINDYIDRGFVIPVFNPRIEAVAPEVLSYQEALEIATKEVWHHGQRYEAPLGHPTIQDGLGRLNFHIFPRSFFQVNTAQAEVLYNKVLVKEWRHRMDIFYGLFHFQNNPQGGLFFPLYWDKILSS